ncbi:uncharacterized protein LOC105700951 [Orussus abietinus]|uniref:uncharacterized protein LOC105700951 n=1 Tax=Orussus abietinus TaxID=222816 RepID=UPI00062525FD|nr:uncharacterized protein LOC105700951 [Orussus abietinus]
MHRSSVLLFLLHHCMLRSSSESRTDVCGGRLTGPRGVISTPNFPGVFQVPIRCQWIIDASEWPSRKSAIVVYLTQMYSHKGLTFTEYAYYESDSMKIGGTMIQRITEGNVFEFRWIRTFSPYLVIDFVLDRLEGNHVRVLHDLLDVYGFNVTYEMTEQEVNAKSCSLKECSYTGNCVVDEDFDTFRCDCFDGFSGDDCSDGPLCLDDRGDPVCRNQATCKHVGAETIRCLCPPGYSGRFCEVRLSLTLDQECGGKNCVTQCPAADPITPPCDCKNGTKIYNNRSRYECRIKLSNATSLRTSLHPQGSLESLLARQLAKYLRHSNISSTEDLKILSVTPTSEVTFHFFGNANDGDKIRESFNRLVQRRRLGDVALESTHFTFQQKPALKLEKLRINQVNEREVRLGDQFVLSCVAQGSYGLNFTWYKDDMLVNTSKATRGIWCRHLPNDGSDQHTSLLTIDKATLLDAGRYTCQAIDWGIQQCKSVFIEVRDEPEVVVTPMGATIEKGGDIQFTCMTPNMPSLDIGFGWSRNRALLKLEPGSLVWEDLYPAGSVLKVINAQKSAVYTCNVAHRSMAVRVEVVNRTIIPLCISELSWGLRWPETAPGSDALLECPRHFLGRRVTRLCAMKDATTPEWQLPDFSGCLYESLATPYDNFRSLTLGYQNTTGSATVLLFWEILRLRRIPLYPGEADRILGILAEIEHYQYNVDDLDGLQDSAEALLQIVNLVLLNENSILSQQKLLVLQQLVQRNLMYWTRAAQHPRKHVSLATLVADVQPLRERSGEQTTHTLQIPNNDYAYPSWYGDRVTLRLQRQSPSRTENETHSGVVVVYKNITRFIRNAFIKELNDGTDLEYRMNSRVVTVASSSWQPSKNDRIRVDLQLHHLQNHTGSWNISCGVTDLSGAWDLNTCISDTVPEEGLTRCTCPCTGTFAVFLTARAIRVVLAKKERATFLVILGCGSCLLQCLVTLLIIATYWWKHRTWLNFLKLQCCGALAGSMAVFVYAVHSDLPESSFSVVATSLEALLLVGMSAPISQALVIYAELAQIRPSQHLQPTIIAVITGVPVLAILATELTHKTTGWHHESWWLIYGSGVYNIFVSCATTMLLIFALLYIGVLRKSRALIKENVLKRETTESRVCMLHRAVVVTSAVVAMEVSSVFYVNSSSIVFHYAFASFSFLLGHVVLASYLLGGEILFALSACRRFKWKPEVEDEVATEPIKVCSKSSAESENEAAPPMDESYLKVRGVAAGSIDMREYITESPSSLYLPSKSSVLGGPGRFLPEIRLDHVEDINLESYSTSPRKYHDAMSFEGGNRASHCPVAEPYGSCGFRRFPKFSILPSLDPPAQAPVVQTVSQECPPKVLCSAEVESRLGVGLLPDVTKTEVEVSLTKETKSGEIVKAIPDIASTTERKQPDGEEMAPEITVTDCETTVTGMLDRIYHDLDYLLNRTHAAKDET